MFSVRFRAEKESNVVKGVDTVKKKPELALVKKAMRGDPGAFGELIRREQESLYRMAFLYTRNEEDALDALQEGILKAYTHRKTLRKPEHFKTWLMRIVINSAQDLMKKRRPAAEWDELEELSAPEGLPPEERMDLYDALGHLPEPMQQLLKLRYFDGLSNREIANQLEVPEGTVAVQLSRARERLRLELKEEKVC